MYKDYSVIQKKKKTRDLFNYNITSLSASFFFFFFTFVPSNISKFICGLNRITREYFDSDKVFQLRGTTKSASNLGLNHQEPSRAAPSLHLPVITRDMLERQSGIYKLYSFSIIEFPGSRLTRMQFPTNLLSSEKTKKKKKIKTKQNKMMLSIVPRNLQEVNPRIPPLDI